MSRKFIFWLLSVSLVVAAAIIIVLSNSEELTITLFPGKNFSGNKGVLILAVFLCGVAISCLFASYFGLKTFFYERMLKGREKRRHEVYSALEKAKGLLATGDWENSKKIWQQILKHSPNEAIPQIELAKCYEEANDLTNAIKTIEQARAQHPNNQEVLMYSAHLHALSGNKTVALDNIVLASYHSPTPKIFRLARNIAEEIGRIDDALNFQKELEKITTLTDDDKKCEERIKYKKVTSQLKEDSDPEEKKSALNKFLSSFQYAPAVEELAKLLCEENKLSEAGKTLLSFAKKTKQASDWKNTSDFWLEKKDMPQAISIARLAVSSTDGENNILSRIELINLLLSNGNFENAKEQIVEFKKALESANPSLSKLVKIYSLASLAKAHLILGQESDARIYLSEVTPLIQQDIAQNLK